ncbi:MAG: hypothetical protein F4W89_11705 [Acidobacteria bacterium]|nr:hypothetical protein [Acidobacteriota bacterium]
MTARKLAATTVALCACVSTFAVSASAEVIRLDILSREPVDAVPGQVGPYERLRGRVVYALDPDHPANRAVVDLGLAADNGEGRVEFYGDIEILAPRDLSLAQPTILYDINNRGRRLWGTQPFFLRQGYITVWSGWIAQVRPDPDLLRLEAPVALGEDGVPITGHVRAEMIAEAPGDRLTISDRGQLAFEPVVNSLAEATLTRRARERDAPKLIPREQWEFVLTRRPRDEGSGLIGADLLLEGGFEPGVIYELIYEARGSVVQGAGFAAIRDVVSFLRYDESAMNPLRGVDGRPIARRVIGEGRSQSGRALRMFLYEGFNADEEGRVVFDGAMPVISGGGQGFFNHRFASPTRTATAHSGHLYPVDVFPFAYGEETDPFTGGTDGILRHTHASGVAPKVMHLDTSSEYWHRSASLVVTDPSGSRDAEIPEEVRVYVFGGSQHSPGRGPLERGQLAPNPNVYQPFLETLFLAMDRWVTDGTLPPPSVHPRIADGTLVGWQEDKAGWRTLPGVRYPTSIQQPDVVDYGELFATERRIDNHPPVRTGERYEVRVPALDDDNNELGVLRMPAVAAPIATYTSWNLRAPAIGQPDALLGLAGGIIPFPKTRTDREAAGDPRLSTEERYAGFDAYLAETMRAAEALVAEGYLLDEHLAGVKARAEENRSLFSR